MLVASCNGSDAVIAVDIATEGTLAIDCVEVSVAPHSMLAADSPHKRVALANAKRVVLVQGSLPADVDVRVRGLRYPGACDDADVPGITVNTDDYVQLAHFKASEVTVVSVTLKPPSVGLDADGDGFVSALKGGPDCNDTSNKFYPGADEGLCLEDNNCNGLKGCDEDRCKIDARCANQPTRLSVVIDAEIPIADECSRLYSVELQDATGTPRTTLANRDITLSSSANSVSFYAEGDVGCMTPLTGNLLSVPSSQFRGRFHVKSPTGAQYTITASEPKLGSASKPAQIYPRPTSALVFIPPQKTLTATACSATSFQVELQSAANTPTLAQVDYAIGVSSTPSGAQFYADANCTRGMEKSSIQIPANMGRATFWARANTATGSGGPLKINAQLLTPQPRPPPGITQPVSQDATVLPGPPYTLTFPPNNSVIMGKNTCKSVEVLPRDDAGNPTPADVSLVPSAGSSLTFSPDPAACSGATAPLSFHYDPLLPKSFGLKSADNPSMNPYTVTGTTTGVSPATLTVNVTAGAPAKISFVGAPPSIRARGCATLGVALFDDGGFPAVVSGSPLLVALTHDGGSTAPLTFYSDTACTLSNATTTLSIAPGNGTASFGVSGKKSGTLGAIATAPFSTPSTDSIGVTVAAGNPSKITLSPPAGTYALGKCSTAPFTATRWDQDDNVVDAGFTPLNFGATGGSLSFFDDGVCGNGPLSGSGINDGQFSRLFSVKPAGVKLPATSTINVSSSGLPTATTTITLSGGDPVKVALVDGGSLGIPALDCSSPSQPLRVELRDLGDNVVNAGATTTVNLSSNPSNVAFYSDNACGTGTSSLAIASGTSSSPVYFKGTSAGTSVLTASSNGLNSSTIAVNVGPPVPRRVVVSVDKPVTEAGECINVTATLKDAAGNNIGAVGNTTFNLTASPPASPSNSYAIQHTLYAAPDCVSDAGSSPLSITFPGGASTFVASFRPFTGATPTMNYQVAASGGSLPAADAGIDVTPMVRHSAGGSCAIANNAGGVTCPVPGLDANALGRTMLLMSSGSVFNTTPASAFATCRLVAAGSAVNVVCERAGVNVFKTVAIEWSTVTFRAALGAQVQSNHIVCNFGDDASTLHWDLPKPVDPSKSFVLFSSSGDLKSSAYELFASATLNSGGTAVDIKVPGSPTNCGSPATYDVQVVTHPGVSVTRGELDNSSVDSTVFSWPTIGVGPFMLYSTRAQLPSPPGADPYCAVRFFDMPDGGSTHFARGCTSSPIEGLAWERIDPTAAGGMGMAGRGPASGFLPLPQPQVMGVGAIQVLTSPFSTSKVDLSRTVWFSGQMGPGGQNGCMIQAVSGPTADDFGASQVEFEITGVGLLGLHRERNFDNSCTFESYGYLFNP